MSEYEFELTKSGVLGTLPSGEQREFATESEYWEAYRDEEDEIVDELFDLNNGYEIEDDFNSWLEYA